MIVCSMLMDNWFNIFNNVDRNIDNKYIVDLVLQPNSDLFLGVYVHLTVWTI